MRVFIKGVMGALVGLVFFTGTTFSATFNYVLPPNDLPFAQQYDDFWSYSAKILTDMGYKGFETATGTGGLDLILLTGAGGSPNKNVAGTDWDNYFMDPVKYTKGTTTGTWSTEVDMLVPYMQYAFGISNVIPVFTFDLNQEGKQGDMLVTAYVQIWDPINNSQVALWSFDNSTQSGNGVYDPDQWIYVPEKLTVLADLNNDGVYETYYADNNKGSGKMDFLVYNPLLNLNDYYDNGYIFNAYFTFTGLNDGFEEIFLTGKYAQPTNPIPEPSTMLLLGAGLLGLAAAGRRKSSKN